ISLRFIGDGWPPGPIAAQMSSLSSPSWAAVSPTPRSIFADDEVRYVPPGTAQTPPISQNSGRTLPSPDDDGVGGTRPATFGAWSNPGARAGQRPPSAAPPPPARVASHSGPRAAQGEGGGGSSTGYPVPAGPLVGGGEGGDLYRRSGATGGPASSLAE